MAGLELYAPRKPRHRRTWSLAAVVLAVVFALGGEILALLPALATGFMTLTDETEGWTQLAYVLFVAFGATAVLTLAWAALFERRGPAALGLNARGTPRFLRGYGIGLAFVTTVVAAIWALGGYVVEGGGAFAGPEVGAALIPIGVLLLGFIVQGSTEELVFRGWLMQLIASRHGVWIAVMANSAVFGLMHAGNLEPSKELALGVFNILLFGVFISLYAVREGSLWGVCGWHAAWNWLLGLGFGLEVSGAVVPVTPLVTDLTARTGAEWWLTGAAFGPEASVVTTVVLGLAIVVLALRRGARDHGVEVVAPTQG